MPNQYTKAKEENSKHKPVIETIINTAAISLTTFGVTEIMKQNYFGFLVVIFGAGLEFLKYLGRKKKFW